MSAVAEQSSNSTALRAQEKKRQLQEEKDARHHRTIKELEDEEARLRRQLANLKAEKDLMSKVLAQLKEANAKKKQKNSSVELQS